MAPQQGMVSGKLVDRLLGFATRRGLDAEAICRAVRLNSQTLQDPSYRVPYTVLEELGERVAEALNDDHFGLHLAQDLGDALTHDAGVLMLMASPSIRAGLERMVRFQRYWGDGERARLVQGQESLWVRCVLPPSSRPSRRHGDECMLAEMIVGMRALSAREIAPRTVRFAHAAPRDTSEHEALFRCSIEFDTEHSEIELDDATLDLRLPQANEAYCAIFECQVTRALASLPGESGATDDVRSAARAMLSSGDCTLASTARILGTSARTLQRRLQACGTSFAEVVDSVRREMAQEYLARQLPVYEIAFLLGYAEPSAFHRAFKRWTGMTPEQARVTPARSP